MAKKIEATRKAPAHEVGAVVRLAGGGPALTVTHLAPGGEKCCVAWHGEDGALREALLPLAALVAAGGG